MADEDEAVNASLDEESDPLADEGGGEGGSKKKIILIVVPLLLLIGIGAGLYFSGFLDKFMGKEESGGHEESVAVDEHGNPVPGGPAPTFLEIPDMIVNLSSNDAQPRYLRLKVQLELKNAEDLARVQQVMPRVVDQFQTYLRELRVKDLRGSAGIYRLQMELLARVNAAAYPVEVQDVLFQEILIQ